MSCDEEFPASACHHHVYAAFGTFRQYFQAWNGLDIAAYELYVTAVRHIEFVVESSEYGIALVVDAMAEHS